MPWVSISGGPPLVRRFTVSGRSSVSTGYVTLGPYGSLAAAWGAAVSGLAGSIPAPPSSPGLSGAVMVPSASVAAATLGFPGFGGSYQARTYGALRTFDPASSIAAYLNGRVLEAGGRPPPDWGGFPDPLYELDGSFTISSAQVNCYANVHVHVGPLSGGHTGVPQGGAWGFAINGGIPSPNRALSDGVSSVPVGGLSYSPTMTLGASASAAGWVPVASEPILTLVASHWDASVDVELEFTLGIPDLLIWVTDVPVDPEHPPLDIPLDLPEGYLLPGMLGNLAGELQGVEVEFS